MNLFAWLEALFVSVLAAWAGFARRSSARADAQWRAMREGAA